MMSDATAGSDHRATREAPEIDSLTVEVNKIMAETSKINREVGWCPFVVGGGVAVGLVGAGAALTGAIIRTIGGGRSAGCACPSFAGKRSVRVQPVRPASELGLPRALALDHVSRRHVR